MQAAVGLAPVAEHEVVEADRQQLVGRQLLRRVVDRAQALLPPVDARDHVGRVLALGALLDLRRAGVAAVAHGVDQLRLGEHAQQGRAGEHGVARHLDQPRLALLVRERAKEVVEEVAAGGHGGLGARLLVGRVGLLEAVDRGVELLLGHQLVDAADLAPHRQLGHERRCELARLDPVPPELAQLLEEFVDADLAREQVGVAARVAVKADLVVDVAVEGVAAEHLRDDVRAAAPRAADEDDRRRAGGRRLAGLGAGLGRRAVLCHLDRHRGASRLHKSTPRRSA